jgi:hypothetical protein
MQANQYGRRRTSGFRVEEVRRDCVSGRFIERLEWEDTLEDPAGGELSIHRVELRQVRFRLASVDPQLEILDSPRSLRSFVEQLSICADTTVRVVEISIAPDAWLEELEDRVGKMTVTGLTAAGLTLSAATSAAVAITGTEDVRRFLTRFTGGSTVGVERVVASLAAPYVGRVELLIGGRAGIVDGDGHTIEVLRESLRTRMLRAGSAQ